MRALQQLEKTWFLGIRGGARDIKKDLVRCGFDGDRSGFDAP